MHLSDLTDRAADNVRSARTYLEDLATPTVRLGVTGLSRAGKTVFITALVRALTAGALRPPIRATTLPGFRGYLEPQPDDDVPRFGYEAHLAALSGDAPVWPESTRQISQLRLTLEWQAGDWTRQTLGIGRRLHLDIVDYPGEWLVDLALLDHSFETWSASAIEASRRQPRDGTVERWLSFVESVGGRV
ncbi:MAG TPA: YcjX family protein, partial [Hyphomicrobiaceae bacterium]|nr:YcjX family protein [Hyphomicrobiaceae bacterium]